MDKKTLLLCGLGFIGTNFYKLFKDKYRMVIFDICDYACTLINGLYDLDNPNFYKGDISEFQNVKKIIEEIKPDYIINFAAKSHVDRSIHEEDTFIKTNVIGVENLLKIAKDKNIRLLHISTDEVYGDLPLDNNYEFKEEDKLNPSSPYSASKAAADMICNAYYRTYGVNVVTVRPTNNYGPYQYPEKLIPFFIKRLLENKTLPVYGKGENIREWLYVEDCCKAIELVLRGGKSGEVYNIGSENRYSNLVIAGFIDNNIEFVEDRPGHDRKYSINSDKLKELGWKPEKNLKDGLLETKEWYIKNKNTILSLEANKHIK